MLPAVRHGSGARVAPRSRIGYYQPGCRYGVESATRYRGREWNDVEADLQRDWDRYGHRGQSTWEQMKAAVRDAWDRVTGKTTAGVR